VYKKKVKYKDYHGEEREEIFDFNLSDSEIMELEAEYEGSITEMMAKLSKKSEHADVIKIMKKIVLLSYGVISDDGRRFIKNDEVRDAFYQTEAYSRNFTELATNDVKAAEFFERIISDKIFTD